MIESNEKKYIRKESSPKLFETPNEDYSRANSSNNIEKNSSKNQSQQLICN